MFWVFCIHLSVKISYFVLNLIKSDIKWKNHHVSNIFCSQLHTKIYVSSQFSTDPFLRVQAIKQSNHIVKFAIMNGAALAKFTLKIVGKQETEQFRAGRFPIIVRYYNSNFKTFTNIFLLNSMKMLEKLSQWIRYRYIYIQTNSSLIVWRSAKIIRGKRYGLLCVVSFAPLEVAGKWMLRI